MDPIGYLPRIVLFAIAHDKLEPLGIFAYHGSISFGTDEKIVS